MAQEKIKKLLELADEQEIVRLKIFNNTSVTGLKKYNEDPTTARANNWQRAEKELDELVTSLSSKYLKSEITFPNVLAVVDYLKAHDWKVGKSLAYLHKKERILRPQKDGLFYLKDVEKYAANHLHRVDGSRGSDVDQLQEEKKQIEKNILLETLRHKNLKNNILDGLYVPRDAFERELAQRAIIFKADHEAFSRTKAPEIVNLVGGEKHKTPDLIEYLLDAFAAFLNRYSADKDFTVPVPADIVKQMNDEIDEEDDAEG